jgi:hypothetical protein
MKMLRYIVVVLFALVATDALAWNAEVNKAVLMFAEQKLSNKTKKEVNRLLGAPLSSVEFEKKGKNKSRLDENGKSVTTNEKDAVVKLEKAIATLQNKSASTAERGAALRSAVELTVDIHCLANILIDKHLEKNFTFRSHNSMQVGFIYYTIKKQNWASLWQKVYHNSHGVFSAEMYLYDWNIATEGMAKRYKREGVEPRRWAEKSGERVMQALKLFQPDVLVENVEIPKMEEVNNVCLYDAAFHLANLLNKLLK